LLNEKRKHYIGIIAESELTINELVDGEATFTPQDSLLANLDISIPDATSNPYPALIKRLELLQQNITLDNAMKYLAQLSAEKSAIAQSWAEASEQFPPNRNQANIFQLTNTMTKQFTDAAKRLSQVPAKALIPFATPKDKNLKRALKLNKQWLRSAEKTLSGVAWPAQLKQPLVLETLSNSIATCAARSIEINGEYAILSAELKDLVKSIQRSAESGSLKLASQGLSRARNIQKLGISGLEKEINSLSAQVGEMRDWQDFATHPKRDQLILDLEKLVQNSLEPLDQADKLKELRGQWNALGILRKEESELQKRFDDLAEQAFGVCTLYYAAQDTIKSDNLARRKKLCTDIEAYISATDWANADLQAVENIMRTARSEWRTYHPCENKLLKPIEKAFETAQAKLYKFIKEGKGKNVAAKEAIISDAKALLELKDLTTQTAQAKALQARWKSIGTTPRGIDQRLWREFRKICDEIFKRLSDSRNAEATATKAKQQMLTSAIEAFNAKESDIAAFKTNFETLATLADATKLTNGQVNQLRELRKTMHDLQLASKHSRVRSKLQQWSDWDAAVSKAEQNSETIESPHNIFANRIAGIYPDEDLERLTVEAEIAADISSPDKYRSLRMSLQVALMNAGRRNMQLVDNKEFIDRWCSAGPKLIKHNTLRQRFFKALEHRLP
jgi:hypothetical protein